MRATVRNTYISIGTHADCQSKWKCSVLFVVEHGLSIAVLANAIKTGEERKLCVCVLNSLNFSFYARCSHIIAPESNWCQKLYRLSVHKNRKFICIFSLIILLFLLLLLVRNCIAFVDSRLYGVGLGCGGCGCDFFFLLFFWVEIFTCRFVLGLDVEFNRHWIRFFGLASHLRWKFTSLLAMLLRCAAAYNFFCHLNKVQKKTHAWCVLNTYFSFSFFSSKIHKNANESGFWVTRIGDGMGQVVNVRWARVRLKKNKMMRSIWIFVVILDGTEKQKKN